MVPALQRVYLAVLPVLMTAIAAEGSRKYSATVCLVADSIQLHNSAKKWWWSPFSDVPEVARRPGGRYLRQEWIVFSTPSRWGTTVAEFAHKTADGSCRFLLHEPGSSSLRFGEESTRCRPHQNGLASYFTISFDPLSNRAQITLGSGQGRSAGDNVFLGQRGKILYVTNLRSSFMRWWKINFSNTKHCSDVLFWISFTF